MTTKIRIKEAIENTLVINKSIFICYLERCFSEEEAKDFIHKIRKKHYDANHVCTAYIIDNKIMKASDDQEPSKTAGMPMLETLKKTEIDDVCACVVRYFGGIKLGAGGLIRAYSNSVKEAVNKAEKVVLVNQEIYKISFDYNLINKIDYLLEPYTILSKDYEERVTYTYASDSNIDKIIIDNTSGLVVPIFLEQRSVEKPINE